MNSFIRSFNTDLRLLSKKATEYRKYLHSFPELSGREKKTSQFIEDTLKNIGVQNVVKYSGHGLSAFLSGKNNDIVVGIRAEMDALPIDEANDVDYASKNKGVMHACGHDVHMGILLSFAELLNKKKSDLPVGVKIIFQPSEETLPGGAFFMIDQGVLKDPAVNYMLGFHVLPEMKAGNTGFRQGVYMASSDEIYLTLIGKGGHAAMPHLLNDPVVCAAQIITTMQQVISRRASPDIPSVLSFGKFIANGRTNVIPDVVEIEGTFRTFDEKWRTKAHGLISDISMHSAATAEIVADMKIVKGYPVLYNDPGLTMKMKNVVTSVLGKVYVEELPLRMTADDFAYYTQEVPSCYFRLGVGDPGNDTIRYLHTPLFDVHDDVFVTGLKALTACVFSGFGQKDAVK